MSRSTCATASSYDTSGCSTCVPEFSGVTWSGSRRPGRVSGCARPAWSPSCSVLWRRFRMRSNRWALALASASRTGWDGLLTEQREYLDDVWDRADIELDGDPALQQAVRFAVFHVVQAAARAEGRGIPAKGLTGRGYDGHTFWDTETYTLPVLTYTVPAAAHDALRWRHSTLALARARARELRLAGATFPWRTIRGEECSGYWPAGTAAFHINADIADA